MYYALMFLLLFSCTKHPKMAPPPVYPVRTVQVEEKDCPIFLEALGHVDPITSVQIYSRIEGELTGVFFEQGKEVHPGDLLFTIDPKPYLAALQQAQGALEKSLANLALSEEKVRRYQSLAAEDFYSQINYETLQADMAMNQAQVKENQALVDKSQIDLDYCWIYSPIEGKTGILEIDYGNLIFVESNSPLVLVNQMSPIYVTFSLPEIHLPSIRKAQAQGTLQVLASFEDFSSDVFEGELYMLDNEVQASTGMIRLRALFPNTEHSLWPGQFCRNRLILEIKKNALSIPWTAVQMTLNGPIVFVVREDHRVEQRSLKLGQRTKDTVLVLDGLHPKETLVLEGQINLQNGSKVRVVSP